ncbi:phosphoglycerate mutase [Paludibacterium paludis]|uniref:Phosphoglycerate mutase n=1 Tax=Paludibacterium paludis TaxID=1225769 RepID=A0A918U7F8_9NEIS|nr:phosphoglycerate mutase [Paludibacterium paludis]
MYFIRHGQAGFDREEYDALSPLGERQSVLAGAWLAGRRAAPDAVFCGRMARQRDTARLAADAAGGAVSPVIHDGFDEFDYLDVLARARPGLSSQSAILGWLASEPEPRKAFQSVFASAMERWMTGYLDDEYRESWPAFQRRILGALEHTLAASRGADCVWVVTSGGVIAALCKHWMSLSDRAAMTLNWRLANAGITHCARRGDALEPVSLNVISHLDHEPSLVSYR